MDRTRATLAMVTALLCACKSDDLTDAIEERRTRIDPELMVLAVDTQNDWDWSLHNGLQ